MPSNAEILLEERKAAFNAALESRAFLRASLTSAAQLRFGNVHRFTLTDRGLRRVALRTEDGYISVAANFGLSLRRGAPGQSETFQWMETFDGEVILMSLADNRFLRVNDSGVVADSPGPRPDGRDGVRLV